MHAVSTNQIADILHYNDNRKYYHWYSQKSFQRITERLRITKSRKIKQVPTVFNFHEWQYNTEYLQVLVVHRRFCQQLPCTFCKLKMSVPTMYHCYRKLCQSPKPKFCFLMFWSVAMVDSSQQRNWVCICLETIKTHYLERPLSKFT